MLQPHWELKHEWILEDIQFWIEQIWEIKQLLKKHPDDPMGDIFRDMLKTINAKITVMKKEYKKIYGDLPPLIKIKREIELKCQTNQSAQTAVG